MKTKQKPTVTASGAFIVGVASKQRSKEEEPIRLQRQRLPQTQCERERKHEAARKEREAQAQQLKKKSTPAPTPTSTRARTVRMPSKETAQITAKQSKTKVSKTTTTITENAASCSVPNEETAQLRLQLEHLSQLSQQDFEREFRKWMAQEGIEGKVQAQVRMDLINSFNSTSLGRLLRKAMVSASAKGNHRENPNESCLLISPMLLALHTLVAEFLYVQNYHYTLSVYCSEMPHRHTLPDFESRAEFRFNQEELQQVIKAILGEHNELQLQLGQTVLRLYEEQQVSLLMGFFKVLVNPLQGKSNHVTTNTSVCTTTHRTEGTQTQPAACIQSTPDVDTTRLFQAEELIVAADGRTVFIGPRVSQSINGVEQQLGQLMHQMRDLCKSCAPPVEIISQPAFEQLLHEEILERQRLLSAGETLEPGKTALQLPEGNQEREKQQQEGQQEGNTVLSPAGPIQLPAETASVPKLPHLHAEQVASLAMVQHALLQLQQQMHQPQDCMYVTLERMEALVGELAGCIQTLSNVLNLAMEQEYAVGRHKGFKLGYREGFSHGHFMGVQEGMQSMEQELKQKQTEIKKQEDEMEKEKGKHQEEKEQRKQEQRQLKDCSSQTAMPPSLSSRSVSSQTPSTRKRNRTTSTERQLQAWRNAGSQTTAGQEPHSFRSYEQWIYEMLHSTSGQIFLERVELSLNKALELQKKRLDELFDVKLRHHAELMRLSNRQNSWRTLCRHVERDSQSMEARELVHKIFSLLEHYEAHHQVLAEKIQQTEQAAQRAAHIEPVWKDAGATTDDCNVTPATSDSTTSATGAGATLAPATATAPVTTTAPFFSRLSAQPPVPDNLSSRLPIPLSAPAPDLASNFPTPVPVYVQRTTPTEATGPAAVPAHIPGSFPTATTSVPGRLSISPPAAVTDQLAAPVPGTLTAPLPDNLPAADAVQHPTALSNSAAVSSSTVTMPTLFTQFPLPLSAETTPAPATAPPVDSPGRPLMMNATTNTQLPSKFTLEDARAQAKPSFNEALLSAKNRMLQLEQESDLLEQSFLGYLERARAQKQKLNISANCAREHQQFHRTLDSFREWQLRMRNEVAPLLSVPVPGTVPAPAPIVSPINSGSDLEPESYQFTNAIAVARHKLLSELHATTGVQAATPAEIVSSTNKLLVDQVQDETQELLSRVEATLARVSKPASLQLLAAESQLQLDPLSSGTHSSLERIATPPASRKLQRSMAKMQSLFGNQQKEQQTAAGLKAKRPWSAPINKLNASCLPTIRPHTAPSSLTDAVTPAGNIMGLFDVLSDSTTNSSSLSSSINLHHHHNPLQLVGSVSSGTESHTSSSPVISRSQEFWKRMNM